MGQNKNREAGTGGALDQTTGQLLEKIALLEREVALARRFAYHDPLTGLPNRALMLDRLRQAISQAVRQHKNVGLLFVDLDDFKSVNDELGHQAGDSVLQAVADRLVSCIRACDTACRYGGDEFVILLPEIQGAEELEEVKRKIRRNLWLPHQLGERSILIGGSVGGALFRQGAESCVALIGAADADMYRDKRLSRERIPDLSGSEVGKARLHR
jgi:diguanylate cyclase (GGDEF)-like protein